MAFRNSVEIGSMGSNSQRISYFEYLFVLMLILYAGRGNIFFTSGSFNENPIGVILPVVLSGILVLIRKVKFNIQFIVLIYLFICYFLAVSIKYNEIHPRPFLYYLIMFFVVYSAVNALKFDLFIIYEHILYYLAIIGLLMWGIQIVLGGDTLYLLFSKISLIKSSSYVSANGLSAIFYSVLPSSTALLYNITIPRNCGYAWEPGGFAVYLCLAIFINLFVTNAGNNNKKRFWIFLLALLSTQSTTGYLIFMVIILYNLRNNKIKNILLLLPVAITSMILLSSLPFMKNKIIDLFNETNTVDQMVLGTIRRENGIDAQRFSSFLIDFVDFRDNPIFGLGNIEESWTSKIGAQISTISGIGNILAQHGLVGFLFFIIVSVKNSIFFSKYFNYKGKLLLFLLVLLISVSYSLILIPLVMCFWMFSLFEAKTINQEEEKNVILDT
jgi:hypothetical protein